MTSARFTVRQRLSCLMLKTSAWESLLFHLARLSRWRGRRWYR